MIPTVKKARFKYAVKRSATGLGLFAQELIPAGKKIVEYTGQILTYEEAYKKGGKYLLTLDEKHILDGSPRSNTARYINHSCRPNSKGYVTGKRVWIWSLRNIKAGEEITMDYGEDYFDDLIKPLGCKCKKCAGQATR